MKKGHFIVVEGLEGAGKSTAMQAIKNYFTTHKIDFITTREPGGTKVGESVRQLVKAIEPAEPLDPRAELLLFYAARVQLLECVIKPAIARGCWVLADRFELSTWAYQGGGRKVDAQILQQLSSFCLNGFEPDLLIYLDIDPERGLKRAAQRMKTDRIEQEPLTFFVDVYNAYHARLKMMKNVVKIDASKPLAVVQNLIKQHLRTYLTNVNH